MSRCTTPGCGSYAINPGTGGRNHDDTHLCDVCYWRTRYNVAAAELSESATMAAHNYEAEQRAVAERDELAALLRAVDSDSDGIYCEDIGGRNWFDARAAALARHEQGEKK